MTNCFNERRATYQDIIDRLSERGPRFADEELAVLQPPGSTIEDDFRRLNEDDPVRDAIYATQRKREDEYHARIQRARKDFVDVIPGLWS